MFGLILINYYKMLALEDILKHIVPGCTFLINSQSQLNGTNRQIHVQRIFTFETYKF